MPVLMLVFMYLCRAARSPTALECVAALHLKSSSTESDTPQRPDASLEARSHANTQQAYNMERQRKHSTYKFYTTLKN